jgi:hypothetical protein
MSMLSTATETIIQQKYEQLVPYLNEASLRAWAAVEAMSWGYGGITRVSRATGLSRTTIHAGIAELKHPQSSPLSVSSRANIRQPGGGRKPLIESDPTLLNDLKYLVDPVTRGDPESPYTNVVLEGLTKQGRASGLVINAWLAGLMTVCLSNSRVQKSPWGCEF